MDANERMSRREGQRRRTMGLVEVQASILNKGQHERGWTEMRGAAQVSGGGIFFLFSFLAHTLIH